MRYKHNMCVIARNRMTTMSLAFRHTQYSGGTHLAGHMQIGLDGAAAEDTSESGWADAFEMINAFGEKRRGCVIGNRRINKGVWPEAEWPVLWALRWNQQAAQGSGLYIYFYIYTQTPTHNTQTAYTAYTACTA